MSAWRRNLEVAELLGKAVFLVTRRFVDDEVSCMRTFIHAGVSDGCTESDTLQLAYPTNVGPAVPSE